MQQNLSACCLTAMSGDETAAILQRVRSLRAAARLGSKPGWLSHRNIGLMFPAHGAAVAALFSRAARGLGARVTELPVASHPADPADTARMACMLSRLYDAIEYQGMPAPFVELTARFASVPVFDGLGLSSHPSARLIDRLRVGAYREDARVLVLQAALVVALEGSAPMKKGPAR